MKHPDAFSIGRYASPLASATRRAGANRLTNPDFETNSATGWTNSGWTVTASSGLTPNGAGADAAYASASGTPNVAAVSTLTQNPRVAVTPGAGLYAGASFGAAEPTARGANQTPNYLIISVRFWTTVSGGSMVREIILYQSAPTGNNNRLRNIFQRVTVPASAAYAELYVENRHYGGAAGTPTGTILDDLFLANEVTETDTQLLDLLKHKSERNFAAFDGLTFSRAYQYGDKSATFNLYGPAEYLWDWLTNGLLNYISIAYGAGSGYAASASRGNRAGIWNGFVWKFDGYINGVHYQQSVETLANVVYVPYGSPSRYVPATDPDSIAKYGRVGKYIDTSYDTRAEAAKRAQKLVNDWKDPDMEDDFAEPNANGANYLRVTVLGPLATLSFIHGVYIPGVAQIEISDALAKNANSLLARVRATGNVFLSADYARVDTIGVYVGPSKRSGERTVSAMETLKKYLDLGGKAGATLIAGCFGSRDFVLKTRGTGIDYTFENVDGALRVRDAGGAIIPKAQVTAGKLARRARPVVTDLNNSYTDAGKNPANRFLAEVSYDTEADTLTPTPLKVNLLARRFKK
jgi:hypothetical protein